MSAATTLGPTTQGEVVDLATFRRQREAARPTAATWPPMWVWCWVPVALR